MMTTVNGLLISTKIQRILTYIHIHYVHAIRLSEIALVFNNHPAHLSRKFKKEIGISFLQYISNLRIEKSTQLLLSTEKSVKEISYEVGFTRPEIFSKAFKRLMGYCPTDYRISTFSASLTQNHLVFPQMGPNASGVQTIAEPNGTTVTPVKHLGLSRNNRIG